MNHAHTSNSPALSVGDYPNQPQFSQFGGTDAFGSRTEMASTHQQQMSAAMYGQQNVYVPYSMMHRPPVMNAQIPQQSIQQQVPQGPPQFVPQLRTAMMPAPRFAPPPPPAMPHFPQQTEFIRQEPQNYQIIAPADIGYMSNVPPQFYHAAALQQMQQQQQQQQQQQVPQRQDGAMPGNRGVFATTAQIQASQQQWSVYQQPPTVMNHVYPPQVVRSPRFPQTNPMPIQRPMMPHMQPQQPGIQPDITNEAAAAAAAGGMPQMPMNEMVPRPTYTPRPGGDIVYYDTTRHTESEEKAHVAKPATKRLEIIDPNTGKNVLENLELNARQPTTEALQIQSEFANKVTQRIALGDKSQDATEGQSFQVQKPKQPRVSPAQNVSLQRSQTPVTIQTMDQKITDTHATAEVVSQVEKHSEQNSVQNTLVKEALLSNEVDLVQETSQKIGDHREYLNQEAASTDPVDSGVDLPPENVYEPPTDFKEEIVEKLEQEFVDHGVKSAGVEKVEAEKVEKERMEDMALATEPVVIGAKSDVLESEVDQIKSVDSDSEFLPVTDDLVPELSESEVLQPKSNMKENLVESGTNRVDALKGEEVEKEENADDTTLIIESEKESNLEAGDVPVNNEDMNSESKNNQLKYAYEPGQWTPLNRDGKKVYSRDFLLQLQYIPESTLTPADLPNLPEIIRSSMPAKESSRESSFTSLPSYAGYDFAPSYMNDRTSMGRAPVKRASYQRNDPPVKVITLPRTEDVHLHKTDQAWKPGYSTKEVVEDPEDAKTQELYKKMKGILNKITPSAFERLLNRISQLPIDNETRLSGCIKIIFEKAISEPSYGKEYSLMANRMMTLNVPCSGDPTKTISFRKLLLTRCQEEFEKDKEDERDIERREKEIEATTSEEQKKGLIEAMEEAIRQSRKRSLGNIRFIGELFKLKMLTEKIIHDCINKLLNSDDEESLELLCKLLTTIGKELDVDKSKRMIDLYFTKLANKKGLPPRIRFMVQDLRELRENKWVPRRAANVPKTIDEIHKEALEEKEAKHQMLTRAPIPPKPKPDRRAPGPTSSMEKVSEDGWTTTIGSSSKNRIDPSKMMKIAKSMKDEVQLFAPSWQKSSSACGMGSRGSSQEAEKPLAPSNRYLALEQMGSSSASEFADRNRSHFSPYGRHANQRPLMTESLAGGERMSPSSSLDRSRNVSHERSQERDSHRTTTTHGSARSSPVLPASTRDTPKEQPLEPRMELSRSEIELKATNILDEYFNIQDLKEAFTCVEELKFPKSVNIFVAFALNYVLEKKEVAMNLMGSLFHELLTKGVLTSEQFEMGLKEVLQEAESIAVDIPKFWEYLGDILALTIQNSHELWGLLKSACKELVPIEKDELLFRKTVEALSRKSGLENTSVGLRRSGMRWSDFVHTGLFSHCKQHNLEALDPVREELIALLTQHTDNQPIFDWIQQNVSEAEVESREFVRALVAAVCTCALSVSEKTNVQSVSYTVNEDQMILRQTLLQKYLDHKSDREIQALYALQALLHSLEHPPNVLNQFFDILYDKEIISEEAFVEWENSKDPAEQTGKGVAYQSVRAFFEWLKEGTEETAGS